MTLMTVEPAAPEQYDREYPFTASRDFVWSVGFALGVVAFGVVMLVTGPVVVQLIGGVLVLVGLAMVPVAFITRRNAAILVAGDLIGIRPGATSRTYDWTDLTSLTHATVARHMKMRRHFALAVLYSRRAGRFRQRSPWGVAGMHVKGEVHRRKQLGELPILIPIGGMSRADQTAIREHLGRYGVHVPDPFDDARWN